MLKNSLATPAQTIKVLKDFGLSLDKAYGQNFLVDNNILKKIITKSCVSKEDVVLEVGGGIGTLSKALAQNAKFVHIVELDKKLIDPLKSNLKEYNNYKLHSTDALKLKLTSLKPAPTKMVSNLPYNIATPLVIELLKNCKSITEMYFMVQKEVADRFAAKPNTSEYGGPSVKIQLFGDVKKLFQISANSFLPKPKISSTFIKIKRTQSNLERKDLVLGIIEDGFNYRRKKLINALVTSEKYDEIKLRSAFVESRISVEKRAQELTKKDFEKLANCYFL